MMPDNPQENLIAYFQQYAPVLLLEIDRSGTVVNSNAFTRSLMGWEVVGLHFRKIIVDFSESIDLEMLAAQPDKIHILNVSMPSGSPQTFRCSLLPLAEGTLLIGGIDAAEQQNLSEQFLNLNQQLSNLTRQLQKSNAELARLNQLKNQFLGMAAHDLRKPLGAIMIYSEFLIDEARTTLSEEHAGFLDTVLSSSKFMAGIIDDFLNIAIIESGRLELDVELAALPEIVDRVETLANLQAQPKEVMFETVQDAAIPLIMMDKTKIEQVLVNLVSNAIEHSHPGSRVSLRTHSADQGVVIDVEDSGVGIPPEALKTLFKPFEMKQSKKTGGEQSTGLGLVISQKIIEAHGGSIEVESKVGKGTIFQVTLHNDIGE